MSKEIIKRAVDRFLSWQLPKDFAPDCHVSFDPRPDARGNPITWPVGTNLLSAEQATAMFEHCLSVDMTSRTEAALRLILPMAKGYASAHPVGNNAAFIAEAEAVLESLSTPAPDPVGMEDVSAAINALQAACLHFAAFDSTAHSQQCSDPPDWNTGRDEENRLAEVMQDAKDRLADLISRLAQGEKSPWVTVVSEEVDKATTKFPTWPTDPLHALCVLGEEFGELNKEMLQLVYEPHKSSKDAVRKEAIQCAAMAVRLLMSLDVYEYVPLPQHKQGV